MRAAPVTPIAKEKGNGRRRTMGPSDPAFPASAVPGEWEIVETRVVALGTAASHWEVHGRLKIVAEPPNSSGAEFGNAPEVCIRRFTYFTYCLHPDVGTSLIGVSSGKSRVGSNFKIFAFFAPAATHGQQGSRVSSMKTGGSLMGGDPPNPRPLTAASSSVIRRSTKRRSNSLRPVYSNDRYRLMLWRCAR
jgi:hypothetical protein